MVFGCVLIVKRGSTDHDVPWKFERAEGQWWWTLSNRDAQRAIIERDAVNKGRIRITPELAQYGPAWSEEFEKSLDNV